MLHFSLIIVRLANQVGIDYIRSTPAAEEIRTVGGTRIKSEALQRRWQMLCILILLAAAILRFGNLTLKPLHHDESVNGFFLLRLLHRGFYQYDPSNYHGPTLYYLAAITSGLNAFVHGKAGLDTFAIRAVPALFGVGTVWLILALRRRIGSIAATSAALLVALSPGAVYFSRDFIHETPFVFFTLAMVVAALRYDDTRHRRDLMLAATSAALLFATKETAVISMAVVLFAYLGAGVYVSMRQSAQFGEAVHDVRVRLRDLYGNAGVWLLAVSLFVVVSGVLYSSFLTNFPKGIYDAVRTFKIWSGTAVSANQHVWYAYLQWLAKEEPLILVLGTMGAILALFRACSRFAVFVGLWWIGLLLAYSTLAYKTPWLTLNMI